VIVVNDGAGQATNEVVADAAKTMGGLHLIEQPANRGPAAARNIGVQAASADLVLFVDDDVIASSQLLSRHVYHHAGGDARQGVLGLVEWHPTLMVTPFMRWLDTTDLQFAYSRMSEGPVESPWKAFYTCNLSLRREILVEAGGFDERFPYPAYEDIELAIRLSRSGFHLTFRPDALAWHGRDISENDFCRRMRMVGESAVILGTAQPDFPDLPPTIPTRLGRTRRLIRQAQANLASVPIRRVRERAYQALIDAAFDEGVIAGQRRISSAAARETSTNPNQEPGS
jgi:GT2 family glycosyltransferase